MIKTWHAGTVAVLVIAFAVALSMFTNNRQTAQGSTQEAKSGGAHYTVVETQGHNLLVTDNAANKLYFYTVDKDKPVGSPLKLRASLDLSKVGEPELTITDHAVQK